jgi:hypothetical protein
MAAVVVRPAARPDIQWPTAGVRRRSGRGGGRAARRREPPAMVEDEEAGRGMSGERRRWRKKL